MGTRNPRKCQYCYQFEGYLGCYKCLNYICHRCADGNYSHEKRCPTCGNTDLAANAGDRW